MSKNNHPAIGRHLLVDIFNVDAEVLDDEQYLAEALLSAANFEGVTILSTSRHKFTPQGVTILLMLSESHISLHTYPEEGKAFFDAFTCGLKYDPARIFNHFAQKFPRGKHRIVSIDRG